MKLRTLLAVLSLLFLATAFAACREGGDNTLSPLSSKTAPSVTLAFYTTVSGRNTTKAKTLATTVTTTPPDPPELPSEYFAILPDSLPDGAAFEIHTRFGLDDSYYYSTLGSTQCSNITWDSTYAIYGNALSFACNIKPDYVRAQCYVDLFDYCVPVGARGIMWYVDFSRVDPDPNWEGPCASISLNGNAYRSRQIDGVSEGVGYYYQNGEWVPTVSVNACRMQLPKSFVGWVYVPLTSYNGEVL